MYVNESSSVYQGIKKSTSTPGAGCMLRKAGEDPKLSPLADLQPGMEGYGRAVDSLAKH